MSQSLKITATILFIAALTACGGGSGGTPSSSVGNQTFVSVAAAGELISYTVNTTDLTYSYEITESAFGKKGVTGQGTLKNNGDGTYTPSRGKGLIRLNANGVIIGSIDEDLDGNGTAETVPIFGVSNPLTTFADAAEVYNLISHQCVGSTCRSNFGTIELKNNGDWQFCISGDIRNGTASCSSVLSGTSNLLTSGRIQLLDQSNVIGSLIAHKDTSRNQKIMFIDFADTRTTTNSFGKGIAVGSEIQEVTEKEIIGKWVYMSSRAGPGSLEVSANSYTDSLIGPSTISILKNSPWGGMARTANSFTVLLAGTGMFAAAFTQDGRPQISIGLKVE